MSYSNDQELYRHRRLQILEQQGGGVRNQFLSIIVDAAGPDSYSNFFLFIIQLGYFRAGHYITSDTLHTLLIPDPGRGYCGVESFHQAVVIHERQRSNSNNIRHQPPSQ